MPGEVAAQLSIDGLAQDCLYIRDLTVIDATVHMHFRWASEQLILRDSRHNSHTAFSLNRNQGYEDAPLA